MKMTRKDAIKVSAGANASQIFGLEARLSQEVLIEKKILSAGETVPVTETGTRNYHKKREDRTIWPAWRRRDTASELTSNQGRLLLAVSLGKKE